MPDDRTDLRFVPKVPNGSPKDGDRVVKVGISFDLAPTDPSSRGEGPDDRFEEFDRPETVEAIAEVIEAEGHQVVRLGDGREFPEGGPG